MRACMRVTVIYLATGNTLFFWCSLATRRSMRVDPMCLLDLPVLLEWHMLLHADFVCVCVSCRRRYLCKFACFPIVNTASTSLYNKNRTHSKTQLLPVCCSWSNIYLSAFVIQWFRFIIICLLQFIHTTYFVCVTHILYIKLIRFHSCVVYT